MTNPVVVASHASLLNEVTRATGVEADLSTQITTLAQTISGLSGGGDTAQARDDAIAAAILLLALGTASTHPASDFATPAALSSAISSAVAALSLGTASTHPASDFATPGSVASSVSTAISGLGTASTHPASDFVTPVGMSTAISTLVGGAPGLLDTLNEIAAALGDDPDFAATILAQLATKATPADIAAAIAALPESYTTGEIDTSNPTREQLESRLYQVDLTLVNHAGMPQSGMRLWAGLVTLDRAVLASDIPSLEAPSNWYLLAAGTSLDLDGYNNGTYAVEGDPAGPYVAMWDHPTDPPSNMPSGWHLIQSRPLTSPSKTVSVTHTTTLLPMPVISDVPYQNGGNSFYVDEGGLVTVGDVAYWISGGTGNNNWISATGQHVYYLPYILPLDMTTKQWLDPVKIPAPPWATQETTLVVGAGGGQVTWVGQSLNLYVNGVPPDAPLRCLMAYYSVAQASPPITICPALPVLTGWTFEWTFNSLDPRVTSYIQTPGSALNNFGATALVLVATPVDPAVLDSLSYFPDGVNSMHPGEPFLPIPFVPIPNCASSPLTLSSSTVNYAFYAFAHGGLGFQGGYYGVVGTKIYFGGGDGNWYGPDVPAGTSKLASYDTVTGVFDWSLADCPLNVDYGFYAVADGKLWTWNGAALAAYNPVADTWTSLSTTGTLPIYSDMSQGFQVGRRILWSDYGCALDIDTLVWSDITDPITGSDRDSAVALAPDGRIWLVGRRRDGTQPSNTNVVGTRIFDPTDDTWLDPESEPGFFGPVGQLYGDNTPTLDTFGWSSYGGLVFAPDDTPLLFAGTAIQTATGPFDVQLPFVLDTAPEIRLGDGKGTASIVVRKSPTDPTKLATYAADGVTHIGDVVAGDVGPLILAYLAANPIDPTAAIAAYLAANPPAFPSSLASRLTVFANDDVGLVVNGNLAPYSNSILFWGVGNTGSILMYANGDLTANGKLTVGQIAPGAPSEIVMGSPSGAAWRVKVSDAGALVVTAY